MTRQQKQIYEDTAELRKILHSLKNRKFILDCGHHVTFGYFLGNDITILNGKKMLIVCTNCHY